MKLSIIPMFLASAVVAAEGTALRGGRDLSGIEYACVEIDVDDPFFVVPEEAGPPFAGLDFCALNQFFIDNADDFGVNRRFFNVQKNIIKTCCSNRSGDAAFECCRCNRQLVGDSDTRFFFFRSLDSNGECPGIFDGGDIRDVNFVEPVDVAPGQLQKVLGGSGP